MKTKYIKSFLLFLLLGCCISVSAQNIQGVVTDSLTNDPIPYLSVFYEGKGVGSITDNDGHYKVETRKGWNKLTFSAVGYVTKVVNIIPGVTKNLNVRMRPDDIMLDEVVVKPKREKYSRKNNPAVELMKKVIAHKNNNKLSENDYYQYNKYQKITMSLNDVTPEMLEKGMRAADRNLDGLYKCCVNTELNSTNFLINGEGRKNYLVDWEKPVCSTPAQDLGHFLAPTTTFWKTDVILTKEQTKDFIKRYISASSGRFDTCGIEEQTMLYIPVTCLRGITWCAMATVEYSGERAILNETTAKKLKAYLSGDFLEYIDGFIGENL